MSSGTYYFKFNKKFVGVLHNVLLLAMLHSSFVAPCQGIIQAYVNLKSKNIVYGNLPNPAPVISNKEVTQNKEANVILNNGYKSIVRADKDTNTTSFFSDLQEGIIGVSKEKPLDSPTDNLFTFGINELPTGFSKAYLKYEVYGVSGEGVARSINAHRSYGGHIVQLYSGWSPQREEIDINWLKKGNNTVLFTTGAGALYQYKIRNLSVEFERSGIVNSQLVINSVKSLIAKDGEVYIKGFLRNSGDDTKVYAGQTQLKIEDGEFEGLVALDEIKNNTQIILVKAFDSKGYLGQEPLLIDSTIRADYIIPVESSENSAIANFKALKQGVLSTENASLIVPDSALAQHSRLSIIPLRHIDIAPLESGMVNVTKGGKGYRFLPDGTKFIKAVSLKIDYDKSLIPDGYSAKDIKTYFFDTSSRHWKEVKRDSIDIVSSTIKSQTTHFTDYINGIIQTPESPEANAFASTMMSDIKAADPASEMTLISPPKASQTGEGNISYPIKIPAGRNGMQPNVGLQYSSNGGSGWLGEGWNISSPAITIDTRWGVPLHDPVNESELYNLNGDQLMYPNGYLPNRHVDTNFNITSQTRVSNTVGGIKIFKLRKEGGFSKIERYGNSPATYYWKVTNSSGTVSWYGGKTASDVTNGNAVIKDQIGRIVHWALYMVEDVFGNQIKYSYTSPSLANLALQYPNLANCKTFYLETISYTGYNDTQYFYSVQFTRQSAIRPDVTINARLGLKQANPYLLDKIIVKYNSSVVRSYQLNYISGKFDKKLLTSIAELDGNNLEFYRHNFNYYDDIAENDGHLFGPEKTVNLPTIDANFTLGLGDLLNPSKISTTQTSNNGFSIKPSLGVEVNYRPTSKLKTILVGAPYSQNTTKSKGKIELVDIDGDGIDDILFKASGGLRYFPGVINLDTNGNLVNGFASGIKTIHNVSDFSYGKIKTNSVFGDSWDVTIGVSANHRFMAGTERTKNKSEGSVYLIDANNDGLMDIVSNGAVKFNYIDTVTGEPTFTAESSNTPNLVLKTSLPIVSEPAEQQEEQENPQTQQAFDDKYDVVRVWQAPVDGTIQVIVKLLNLSGGEGEFVVEKLINGNRCTLLREHIVSSTNNQFLITNNNVSCDPAAGILRVTRGEQIYFRLHRNATGQNPEMIVSTEVDYLNMTTVYPSDSAFNLYSNSFILTDKEPVTFPGDGTATITWNSFQPTYLKDAVKYGIYKKSIDSQGNIVETAIQEWNCLQGIPTTISSSGLSPVAVNEGTSLIFKAFSDTNVFIPDNVALWRPKLTFTPTSSAQSQGATAFVKNVTPDYNVYHADSYAGNYILRTASTDPGAPTWSTPTGQTTYGVKPNNIIVNNNYLTSSDSGSFLFAVRGSNGNIIDKRRVIITSGAISISNTNPVNFCTNCALSNSTVTFGPYRFEYYVDEDNIPLFEKYKLAVGGKTAILNYGAWSASQNNKIAVVSYYYDDLKHLGPMLNNWGQFMYNSSFDHNTATPTGPIGKLINPYLVVKPFTQIDLTGSAFLNVAGCNPATMSDSEYENCYANALMGSLNIPAEGTDMSSVNIDNIISGLQGQFPNLDYSLPLISMSPVAGQNFPDDKWQGFYNSQYISYANMRSGSAEEVSASSSSSGSGLSYPDFTNEDEPVSIVDNSLSGMKAINKIHRSSARSNSAGWGWSGNIYGASGIYSTSRTSYSNSVTDFMDINGDGYPDIVTTDAIQKTNRTGGHLASYGNPNTGTVTKEENTNSGIVASGQYLRSGRKTHTVKDTNGVVIAKYETSLEAQVGVGVTANLGGQNEVNDYWADLNGDGLPDRIKKDNGTFNAELNYGQNIFGGAAAISEFPYLNSIESSPTLLSVNVGLGAGSALNALNGLGFGFEASVNAGYSASAGRSDTVFIDINGDGLADKVDNNEVHFNRGIGFNNAASGLGLQDSPNIIYSNNQSIGVTGSIGAFFGFPIVPFVLYAKAGFTFSAQSNVSINQDERNFRDMNGDGFVDYIRYESGQLKVKYSNIGRTNMLKTVNNPLGGSFIMDYQASTKSYGDPNGRWNLISVAVNDGYDKINDGADAAYTTFVYENGNYDRRERQFYGYETVKTLQYDLNSQNEPSTVYTTNVAKYHNKSYFLNGLVKESYILAGNDENLVFSKSVNTYALKTLVTATGLIDLASSPSLTFDTGGTEGRRSAVALLTETTNYIYELGTTPLISKVQIQYNNRGRILKYIYLGNVNDPLDDYTTDIQYHTSATLLSHNLIDIPSEVTVSINNGAGNEVRRKRSTSFPNENTGTIGTIKSYYNASEFIATQMNYDVYGNLIKVTLPPNDNQEAMFYNYMYDDLQHKYLVNVADALSYKSSTDYDPKLDKVLIQEDIAGNVTNYAYDSFGRLKKVTGPKQLQNGSNAYTIKMDYYPRIQDLQSVIQVQQANFAPVAVTSHYDGQHPGNDIQTYTFVDGFDRVVQLKKDIELPNRGEAMSISGKSRYDAFGRAIEQFHPYFEKKDTAINFIVNEYNSPYSFTTKYDQLNRVIETFTADDSGPVVSTATTTNTYSLDLNSYTFKMRSTASQNNSTDVITESYADVNGRVVKTVNVLSTSTTQNLSTTFAYNAIGELDSYIDAEDISTSYKYDLLGRKTDIAHPDSGTTSYTYDAASNLTGLQTANLANNGSLQPQDRFIKYNYYYNFLTDIHYPDVNGNENISNVFFEYGQPGINGARKVNYQRDATGEQWFEYGNMGELTKSIRSVVGPNIPTRYFTTSFEYDTWNRLQLMLYPDGEKVVYNYNLGGNLKNVTGEISGQGYNYIDNINYDYFEQRTKLQYGNGTETTYAYSNSMRRLKEMNAKAAPAGGVVHSMFYNHYEYDNVGNVTNVASPTTPDPINGIGGDYIHEYYYDNMNRLSVAGGYFYGDDSQGVNGPAYSKEYNLVVEYNATNGMAIKSNSVYSNITQTEDYQDTYNYESGTHRLVQITDAASNPVKYYKYDSNGNVIVKGDADGPTTYFWDESNRLRVVMQDITATMQHYIYDASGQRILKASSNMESVYENGMLSDQSNITLDTYTTYPSAYIVLKGSGEYTKHYYAGSQRIVSRIGEMRNDYFENEQQPRAVTTAAKGSNAKTFDAYALKQLQIKDLNQILEKAKRGVPVFKPYEDKEDKEEIDETPPVAIKAAEDKAMAARAPEAPSQFPYNSIYFYHPDHLGTTNYLTDANGQPYQMFMNMPFGESLIEQHSLTEDYETPYKFNGKELDSETGLYYYGARYYDPRTSIWLSTDPLMEMYPSVNPYAYCLQNPINFTDPTGMSVDGDGDGNKGWVGRAWNTVKSWFSGGSDYKPIPSNNKLTIDFGEPSTYAIPEESWTDGNRIYNRVNPSTLEIYNPSTSETTYGLSLPQDFGTWGQEGSDGQIWIGCTACHADNGAYRTIAYSSKGRAFGLIIATLIQSVLPIPSPSALTAVDEVGVGFNTVDDIMANPSVLRGKSPSEVAEVLEGTANWRVETLGRGSQKGNGWVFRQYNAKGNPTGPQLRWHPGGGHHGAEPYWRVVGPQGDVGGIIK